MDEDQVLETLRELEEMGVAEHLGNGYSRLTEFGRTAQVVEVDGGALLIDSPAN
jgi:Mn-dependent DtxR family transcriptional regulator